MKNKIALITGATSKKGKAGALTFAKMGFDIIGRLEEKNDWRTWIRICPQESFFALGV